MNLDLLKKTAAAMVAPGKGILAMDESHPTCNKRFEALGIATTVENRRAYRDMLVTGENLVDYLGGAILFDETLRQKTLAEVPFAEHLSSIGVVPGVKVDAGAKALALHSNEKVTEGLDGLRERLKEYFDLGARFAKWRAVITIGDGIPSDACLVANAHALARYAALCQEADIVPIVEPEVLIDGDHTIQRSFEVTQKTQQLTFEHLQQQGIVWEGMVLKPSMVISGKDCPQQAGIQQVAEETIRCLLSTVPKEVPGIAFLSGGQSDEDATAHLNAMNSMDQNLPWRVTFSYGRALQHAAMQAWNGSADNVAKAQAVAVHRARMNGLASNGEYAAELEKGA